MVLLPFYVSNSTFARRPLIGFTALLLWVGGQVSDIRLTSSRSSAYFSGLVARTRLSIGVPGTFVLLSLAMDIVTDFLHDQCCAPRHRNCRHSEGGFPLSQVQGSMKGCILPVAPSQQNLGPPCDRATICTLVRHDATRMMAMLRIGILQIKAHLG